MPKKSENSAAPVVTSLPLPSSDSVLVIDLPDGQKLLVGKMAAGSVIEVATWRGTGRPDSRTNRLMLGMSNGDVEAPSSDSVDSQEVVKKLSPEYALYVLRNILPFIALGAKTLISKVMSLKKKKTEKSEKPQESSEEVQEWLSKITRSINENTAEFSTSLAKPSKGPVKTRNKPANQKSRAKTPRKGS